MADIRIKDLPLENTPSANEFLAIDLASTRRSTIQNIVEIGRPVATQAEAEAGTNPTKAMTPLTTAQAIAVQAATAAQGAKADSALQPAAIGTSVQAFDAGLTSIAGQTTAADQMLYLTGVDTYATTALTPFARSVLDDPDAASVRSTLLLGTAATQPSTAFATSTQGVRADDGYSVLAISRADIATRDVTPTKFRTMDGAPWIAVGAGGGPMAIQDSTGQWFQLNFEFGDVVNVLWFGADKTGVADSAPAFKLARDYLQTASNNRGGVLYVPRGTYKLNDEIAFTPYAVGAVYNIIILGEGIEATSLDFSGASAGKHGISAIGVGTNFYIRSMSIKNAPARGVLMRGGVIGTNNFMSQCGMTDVRIQGCGTGGFYTENSFLVSLERVWSTLNTGPGIQFAGFHTTVNTKNVWSYQNTGAAWQLNGVISGAFDSSYGEFSLYGWLLTNVRSTTFNACGAENNVRDGWFAQTGSAFDTGVPASSRDIMFNMTSCFGNQNSTAGANSFAIFLACVTANSRAINITFGGSNQSTQGSPGSFALVLNAVSGAIDIWGYTTTGRSFDTTNVNSGGTLH